MTADLPVGAVSLPDEKLIQSAMSHAAQSKLTAIEIFRSIDSTNSELQKRALTERHGRAVIACQQTAGRGRRGRTWFSPPTGNIYLSLGWRFESQGARLNFLPLAVAVQTCRALARAGISGHGIKWPNDVLIGGRKLAGILVESSSDRQNGVIAVIGVGLNVTMSPAATQAINQPWTDVMTETGARGHISVNRLTGLLLDELILGVEALALDGFEPFMKDWQDWDLLNGVGISVRDTGLSGAVAKQSLRHGIARGIGPQGGLLFEPSVTNPVAGTARTEQLLAAEVSVRGLDDRN